MSYELNELNELIQGPVNLFVSFVHSHRVPRWNLFVKFVPFVQGERA